VVQDDSDRLPSLPGRGGGEGVRTRDHLASSRTLQAWLRSSLALLAIGFAIEKLHLVAAGLARGPALASLAPLGRWVTAGGVVVTAASLVDFLRRRRAIEGSTFEPRLATNLALVAIAGLCGLAVVVLVAAGR